MITIEHTTKAAREARMREVCGALLTYTDKMPGASWSIPARVTCPVGGRLAGIAGSTCFGCYADPTRCKRHGGRPTNYCRSNVKHAQWARLSALYRAIADRDCRREWVAVMVQAIAADGRDYFRWHDSGDVFCRTYLEMILEVARALPQVRFWLPTKEARMVREYIADHCAGARARRERDPCRRAGPRWRTCLPRDA